MLSRYVRWWQNGTKIPAERQAAHLIMHGIVDDQVSELAHELTDEQVNVAGGVDTLIRTLDEDFMSNAESRLFKFWRAMRKHEKTDDMTWTQYIKQTKQVFRDLDKFGLNLGDKVVAIAMREAAELEASIKLHLENMARSLHASRELCTKNVEESLKRLIMDDKEQKVMETTDTKTNTDEQKEQTENEEALWIRSSRFQRGGRYRRYQPSPHGSGKARGQIRRTRAGYRRPHNRCFICNSDKHYAAHCDSAEGQCTGFFSQADKETSQEDSFETFACTHKSNFKHVNLIIDTGATKTVVGEETLMKMTQSWNETEKAQLWRTAKKDNQTKFRFGDSRPVKTNNVILMPIKLQGTTIKMKTFVLPGSVPFLLRVEAMKLMKGKIDIETNTIQLMNDKFHCDVNEAGHFVMNPQVEMDSQKDMHVFHMTGEIEIFRNEKKVIAKLHHKFEHARPHKLIRLIEHSNTFKDMTKTTLNAIAEHVVNNCDVCEDAEERDRRPKNSTIRAVECNESVAIDLTEWWDYIKKEKHIICHMVDESSRLSSAQFVKVKQPETIMQAMMGKWFCIYDTPRRMLHDRGG